MISISFRSLEIAIYKNKMNIASKTPHVRKPIEPIVANKETVEEDNDPLLYYPLHDRGLQGNSIYQVIIYH